MIEATLYSTDEAGELHEDETFTVKFVSLVNDDTYGPPPLVAPDKGSPPLASVGDEVLFINTRHVPAFLLKRVEDG